MTPPTPVDTRPIRVGISSCLLGEEVRFDGGHKRHAFLTDTLGRFVEWVPVCPEVEAGFGTPREPMRLVDGGGRLRLLTVKTGVDVTARLDTFAERRVDRHDLRGLAGYVLKKDSPSCGVERVKVYRGDSVAARHGRGLFASRLIERYPHLPVEEEGRLADPALRENFVERVFACWRLHGLFQQRWTPGALVRFHTAHKLILMAHSPKAYQQLGRLVANPRALSRRALQDRYTADLMTALREIATPRRHANVLMHMAGYLKDRLDSAAKAELHSTIEDFRRQLVPLVVPVTLIRHYVRLHDVSYLAGQLYLDPHPKELMLRNHV
jgi:uncharacterized protein YbgA (DUF1722 family)/uncharacterized protein YbbK (DUF523 family)